MRNIRLNSRIRRMLLFILSICIVFACAWVYYSYRNADEGISAFERETLCAAFVKDHMTTEQGGIRTNYLDYDGADDELAAGAQVLSESMGLIMRYTLATGDTALFDRAFGFVKDHLDTGAILSYRYDPRTGAYPVNAWIDDMRIIRVLLEAGNGYREYAMQYAVRLYDTNVKDQYIYDMYDETYQNTNGFVTLCYIDLQAMRLLAQQDAEWEAVERNMREIAAGGYLGDPFPLYAGAYDYGTGAYETDDIHTVQALITVFNLVQADLCPQRTLEYLKDCVENSAIYGAYRQDGTPVNDIQSTAIYALCARIFHAAGDTQAYQACIQRMNAFQVLDRGSEVYGAFADADTIQAYSFDNLMALLAYRGV